MSYALRSVYVSGVDTREEALAWMETVEVRGANSMAWIQTVTHYYNGCVPGSCSVYDARIASYTEALETVWDEMGADFWRMGMAPPCEPIPAAGRVIDDGDSCVFLGGNRRYWRTETDAGYGGSLRWTNATMNAAPANYAVWNLRFESAGEYELFVHADPAYAESLQAPYTVTSLAGTEELTLDQTAAPVQSIGTFAFEAGVDYEVRVDDDSGESEAGMIAIVADALEVRALSVPETDAGVIGQDASTGADAAIPLADGGVEPPPVAAGCSCRAARSGAPGAAWMLAPLGLIVLARRRR